MDGGDGYTTMWMYLMPLNCTLKNNLNGWMLCGVYLSQEKNESKTKM